MSNNKIYQIFVSSTYTDLKDERLAVMSAIVDMGNVPVGMEQFPAGNMEQMDYIRKLIDNVDYYVIIIAGRYGEEHPTEHKSYTELEFEYAQSKGIPIAILLHNDRDNISVKFSEQDPTKKQKLEDFITRISKNRVRDHWTNIGELKYAVNRAVNNLIQQDTRTNVGWVRNYAPAADRQELQSLQQENARLKSEVEKLQQQPEPLFPIGEQTCVIEYSRLLDFTETETIRLPFTWNQIFLSVARAITNPMSVGAISESIEKELLNGNALSEEQLQVIVNQLIHHELIDVTNFVVEGLGPGTSYTLSNKGRKLYASMTALPPKPQTDTALWKRFVDYTQLSKEEFLETYNACLQGLKDCAFRDSGELAHIICTFAILDYNGIKLSAENIHLLRTSILSMLSVATSQDDLYEIYLRYAQVMNGNSYDKDDTTVQKMLRDYFHQQYELLKSELKNKMCYTLENLTDENVFALSDMLCKAPDHGTPYTSLPIFPSLDLEQVMKGVANLTPKSRDELGLFFMRRYELHLAVPVHRDVATDAAGLREFQQLLHDRVAHLEPIDRLSYKNLLFAIDAAIKRCEGDNKSFLN